MGYGQEFRAGWRHLLAATIGMSLGLALNHYVMSLFAPELIAEFGWSRAQFALIGATTLFSMALIPVAGRFADRVGPRVAATVGFICLPLGYLALSVMTGSFALFFAITILKSVFGILTTTMVFARIAVERFDSARGFALSLLMSGPPIIGALAVPFVADIIADHGWRAGFRALALVSAVGGVVTIAMLSGGGTSRPAPKDHVPLPWREVAALFRSRIFLLITGGMLLVNVPQVLVASQLKLVLQENNAPDALSTWIISLYAGGVAVGRFLSGLALDRVAAHKVAICTLGLPAIGLVAIASPFDNAWLLGGAVLLMALAQGAEGDIGAYLVSHRFPLGHYSMIFGFVMVALTLGSASGSLLLSLSLHKAGSYAPFLLLCAVATVMGALLFFLTGWDKGEGEVSRA